MWSKISSFLAISFLVSACGIYETKVANPNAESAGLTADPSTQITYAEVNQFIVSQSCLSCHGASNSQGGVNLTTYALVSSHIQDMKDDIDSGDMPQTGHLSASQIALFDQWFKQGHLELGGVVTPSPTAAPTVSPTPVLSLGVSFAQVNQAVFQASCMTCHSAAVAKGGVVLDSYANVAKSLSDVTADIDSGDMPENGSLTANQKNLFDSWIAGGAKEL